MKLLRWLPIALGLSALALTGCQKAEEPTDTKAPTTTSAAAPAPNANPAQPPAAGGPPPGSSYNSGMPESVRAQFRSKGAPIR